MFITGILPVLVKINYVQSQSVVIVGTDQEMQHQVLERIVYMCMDDNALVKIAIINIFNFHNSPTFERTVSDNSVGSPLHC